MTKDIELINESFAEISPRIDDLTLAFYTRLFSAHPETKPLFQSIDLIRQRRKLAAMLTLVVTNLSRMDVLVPVLRELGASHVRYGATVESYGWVKDALISSLASIAGNGWTPPVESAWCAAIDIVCREMLQGGERAQPAVLDLQSEEVGLLMEIASNPLLSFKADSLFASYIEKKTNDQEIRLATEVQQSLIPEDFPIIDGYGVEAVYLPAMQVGGDYYDWVMPNDNRLQLAFGDVSGKGLSGALIGCRLFGIARSVLATELDTSAAVKSLNAHMTHRMPSGRFITFAVLSVDIKTHAYQLTNAGHPAPLIRKSNGEISFLDTHSAGGIPIGIDADAPYGQYTSELEPGDSLTFYSDGITEAGGNRGELFGSDRLLDAAAACEHPEAMSQTIVDHVHHFTRGHSQSDDISVLTLLRKN